MAGIDTKLARTTNANQGVEVGAIHIDLATRIVNLLADVSNRRFENPVSRWVSDHGGGDARSVFFQFGVKVLEIHVALVIARDWHDAKTDENGTRGIGPVTEWLHAGFGTRVGSCRYARALSLFGYEQ